jgi:hypothetical protein
MLVAALAMSSAVLGARMADVADPEPAGLLLPAQENVTVTGCLEQDAASRAALYKLIVRTNSGMHIYRLTAPSSIDLGAELGRSVEVTGVLTKRATDRGGREELELAVKAIKRVADRCD